MATERGAESLGFRHQFPLGFSTNRSGRDVVSCCGVHRYYPHSPLKCASLGALKQVLVLSRSGCCLRPGKTHLPSPGENAPDHPKKFVVDPPFFILPSVQSSFTPIVADCARINRARLGGGDIAHRSLRYFCYSACPLSCLLG